MNSALSSDWKLSDLHYELEQNLGANPEAFVDVSAFKAAMTRAERCVARIESPELVPQGTCFLVAPDLVITNNHVRSGPRNGGKNSFDIDPTLVRVRFGHVAGTRISSKAYGLHEDWLVDSSPEGELDYCIIRLAEAAGEDNIGDDAHAPLRGWITPSESSPVENQILHILQHPLGEPLKHAAGQLVGTSGDWVEYGVNTDYGSSGSPVFDCRWQCVALHSRAGKGVNRGVCFRAMLRSLPPSVRALIQQLAPAISANSDERPLITKEPGVSVDLSQFPTVQIQAIANALLKSLTSTIPDKRHLHFEVNLGGSSRLKCAANEIASDIYQRQALEGDLRVLQTQIEVLQEHQDIQALDPVSLSAAGRRKTIRDLSGHIKTSVEIIRERLNVMVDRFCLTR